ncbi:MAG: hypothetical protein CTY35_03730 [Methylotenera sp.]|nr:MAG: hypothetical protein CTY35_03730 [Methylotenera sp.]
MKILFKILLIVFVMQSNWAVAAQYCQHEEDSKVEHIGHHTHKHDSNSDDNSHAVDQKSNDTANLNIDSDCPYCHLFSIKSITSTLPLLEPKIEPVLVVDIYYSYPEIIPIKPERPNWNLAI